MKIPKDSEGFALFVAILTMAIIMLFIGASLFLSRVDTKITSNFKLGTQALEVADAGLQHALAVIQKGYDFDSYLNCGTPPCNLISTTSFSPDSGFTYAVTVENDSPDIISGGSPTDDTDNLVVLISTANGPSNSKRRVQAYVKRSLVSFIPPGALYFPASLANVNFSYANNPGTLITGDDMGYDGVTPGPQPSVTGVATTYDSVKNTFLSALGLDKLSLVQGSGYSDDPLTPSVFTTGDVFDVNQIALNFYNHASAVKYLNGLMLSATDCSSSEPCVFGTNASPQITYIREGAENIDLGGYVTGSGVLVTEGLTYLYGNFNFHGLVVSVKLGLTGGIDPGTVNADYFSLRNNAKIFGAILLGPTNSALGFQIEDDGKIYYNSDAMALANTLCGSCFPQPPRVFAWFDK